MTTNPFTFGNPISDPTRFYGRKQEIRQIVNRLLSSAHESTSVVGERRIGKTSLLNYLANPQVAAGLGLAPDKFCLVYIDFQGLTDITPQRFWQRVLGKMARASCDEELAARFQALAKQDTFDLFDLEDLFETVGDRGLNVILLLDEFEYVTQNLKFGSDFFGGLRALAIHHPLSLIPATRRELVDLCHSDEIKGSPFFNIFANVVLRPFTREDAEGLIEGYVSKTDIALTPEEKESILNSGGGHPLFLQMAGYYLVERKTQGLVSPSLLERVIADVDQQADPHYTYLWSHTPESEKITLLTILALGRQKPSKKTLPVLENLTRLRPRAQQDIPSLIKRGLLAENEGTYALFSPSFARWISREITAPAEEAEKTPSVEAWLKEGGHERLQPIKGVLPTFKKKYWPLVTTILHEFSFEFAAGGALELAKLLIV
jgi:hypothetical protein